MFSHSSFRTAPRTTSMRVWGLAIKGSCRKGTHSAAQWEAALWQALDISAQAVARGTGIGLDPPTTAAASPSLVILDMDFGRHEEPAYVPVIRRLTTDYAGLALRLEVLRITRNGFDEGADLGALALFSYLRELCLADGGLTSLKALPTGLPLAVLNVSSCEQLSALEGIEGCEHLTDLDASRTAITTLAPVSRNNHPLLAKISVDGCSQLQSLAGLEDHPNLTTVRAEDTPITALPGLRGCMSLHTVAVDDCHALTSLDGLQHLPRLARVGASWSTRLVSLDGLAGCTGLRVVNVFQCHSLRSIDALEHCPHLEQLLAFQTDIASVSALRSCRALRKLFLYCCQRLKSLDGLEDLPCLEELDISHTGLMKTMPSVAAIKNFLRRCPRLRTIFVRGFAAPKGEEGDPPPPSLSDDSGGARLCFDWGERVGAGMTDEDNDP